MNKEGPKEYKKGYIDFANCKINLFYGPIIPRKETEFWVKKAIKQIQNSRLRQGYGGQAKLKIKNLRILDIFAGSGCIGIAILKHIKKAHLTFAEIDKNLIKQIKINLKLNKIPNSKYKVVQSDVFKNIKAGLVPPKAGYDYIFANPPYIALKNKHLVQKSVLDYEPHSALFGGKDGLFYIRKFLKDARKYLKPNGKIYPVNQKNMKNVPSSKTGINRVYMEFDCLQKRELEKLLKELNYTNYKIYKDQFKKWRWIEILN